MVKITKIILKMNQKTAMKILDKNFNNLKIHYKINNKRQPKSINNTKKIIIKTFFTQFHRAMFKDCIKINLYKITP